jgi:tetratricopeptide (TPR) repeat protein
MATEATDSAAEAAKLKAEGNSKYTAQEYQAAIDAYSRSLELNPSQHLCYSNRCAAYLKLGDDYAEQALADARRCLELDSTFVKGYNRVASALQVLKKFDEALEVCRDGMKKCPDKKDDLEKTVKEVENSKFQFALRGTWHGTVNQVLGGYDQQMEFLDAQRVQVEVLGRSIISRYDVDCSHDPKYLNIQVPMAEIPPGMPPPPPVPYIAKIDDNGLHMCCPYLKMERPTEFTGPGYCLMKPGPLAAAGDPEVQHLGRKEKLKRCAQELLQALPSSKLEEVDRNDSEDTAGEKLMAQVRFESQMYAVQKRFGEDFVKEVLEATKGTVPAELEGSKELKQLMDKLRMCGIMEDDTSVRREPETEPRLAASREIPAPADASNSAKGTPASVPADASCSLQMVGGVLLVAVAATAALALTLSRRQRH